MAITSGTYQTSNVSLTGHTHEFDVNYDNPFQVSGENVPLLGFAGTFITSNSPTTSAGAFNLASITQHGAGDNSFHFSTGVWEESSVQCSTSFNAHGGSTAGTYTRYFDANPFMVARTTGYIRIKTAASNYSVESDGTGPAGDLYDPLRLYVMLWSTGGRM